MNKEHFLTELKINLKALPPQQVAYILQIYTEKFDQYLAEGLSEVMVSKELGNPQEIANEILTEFGVQKPTTESNSDEWQEFTTDNDHTNHGPYYQSYDRDYQVPKEKPSFFIRFCQIVGLLALNFLFMFWMIGAAVMMIGAFWLVVGALMLAPIVGVFLFTTSFGTFALFQLFVSIALGGVGLVGLAIMVPITRYSFRFIKYYIRWNLNVLRGK